MSAPLVVTPGMGVGPEVCLRALRGWQGPPVVLAGRWSAIRAAWTPEDGHLVRADGLLPPRDALAVFDPGDGAGPAELEAVRWGARACLDGRAAALVTGPLHKARLSAAGAPFHGHTGLLAEVCGVPGQEVMAFTGGELRVALVTTHIPLMQVGAALSPARVAHVGRTAAAALRDDLGLPSPRLLICGLNPHAGEDGLLGDEEARLIAPGVRALRAEGVDAVGPVSAETAFLEARAGRADLIVAMYHDQGLAPLKAVDFGRSVNWSLGLPIVRTSVDHGTADSLVGTGRADPASMRAALELAAAIASRRARAT